MKNKLYLLSGIVVCAIALAFIPLEDEKIKVSVIHRENGNVIIHDTIFDAASGYTVEDFISDKGLDPAQTEIFDTNKFLDGASFHMNSGNVLIEDFHADDSDGEHRTMVMVVDHDDSKGGTETITIQKMVDEDGNVTIEKKVNGEVVRMTPAEMEEEMSHNAVFIEKGVKHKIIEINTDSEGSEFHFEVDGEEMDIDIDALIKSATENMVLDIEGAEVITIKKVVDADGNVTMEKTVNGEVVEGDSEDGNVWISEGEEGATRVYKIKSSDGDSEDVEVIMDFVIETDDAHDVSGTPQIHTIIKEIDEDGKVTVIETTSENGEEDVDVRVFVKGENGESQTDVKVMAYRFEIDTDAHQGPVFMHSDNAEDGPATIAIVTRISGDSEGNADEYQITSDDAKLPIENLNFFPNPNEGKLRLNFFLPQRGKTVISVFDMAGKRVYKSNLGNFEGAYDEEIDLEELESGTYVLRITQNNLSLAEKLIVN